MVCCVRSGLVDLRKKELRSDSGTTLCFSYDILFVVKACINFQREFSSFTAVADCNLRFMLCWLGASTVPTTTSNLCSSCYVDRVLRQYDDNVQFIFSRFVEWILLRRQLPKVRGHRNTNRHHQIRGFRRPISNTQSVQHNGLQLHRSWPSIITTVCEPIALFCIILINFTFVELSSWASATNMHIVEVWCSRFTWATEPASAAISPLHCKRSKLELAYASILAYIKKDCFRGVLLASSIHQHSDELAYANVLVYI